MMAMQMEAKLLSILTWYCSAAANALARRRPAWTLARRSFAPRASSTSPPAAQGEDHHW
eukprot:CAMPEP_0196732356 /NCGR_PEP_ID=MMETSP1091-20130531/11792_1 /TAXON_ID=302021 /ORGANISM="Rhodomonas sp., Strain CCMP768" /LENGTH=58 /DNA_ID=CAMNT_0042075611 /DNA_START=7 /DNA_END=183 /DNA_ORIENTATION=-